MNILYYFKNLSRARIILENLEFLCELRLIKTQLTNTNLSFLLISQIIYKKLLLFFK